jgi:hypothetical protein
MSDFKPEMNYYPLSLEVSSGFSGSSDIPLTNTGAIPPATSNIIPTGGGTMMNGGTLQSPNYSKGVAGWKIDSNGDVEFDNGNFRGDITGASGTFSGTITATTGLIGGWVINSTSLSSTGTPSTSGILLDSSNQLIRVGSTAGNYITIDGPNLRIRSSNYSAGVAGFTVEPTLIEAENLVARGTLRGVSFKYDIVSAVGGQLLVTNSDALASDMTALDAATMTVRGDTTFVVNDILLIRAVSSGIQEEYFRVTDISLAPIYTVTRDLAGTYTSNSNPTWKAGTTVVKIGSSDGAATYSGGWLRLLGEGANSPHYSVFSRTGVAYNSYTERVRLGNLNGTAAFVADTYGIFIGDYSSGNYLTYDDVSGNLIVNGSRLTGNVFYGDGNDGDVTISANTSLSRDMYYNNLTINSGFTLNPNGYKIFVKNILTIQATAILGRMGNVGGVGGNGSTVGGTGGTAAAALAAGTLAGTVAAAAGGDGVANDGAGSAGGTGTNTTESFGAAGVSGGGGGNGNGGGPSAGGAGGTVTAAVSGPRNLAEASIMRNSQSGSFNQIKSSASSGGGGGGGGRGGGPDGGGGGGGGGGPGGMVFVAARTIINDGSMTANGGVGGNGGNGRVTGLNVGGGGGGGGGSGGVLVYIYQSKSGSGVYTANGGVGGTGGTGRDNTGAIDPTRAGVNGTTGNAGVVVAIQE